MKSLSFCGLIFFQFILCSCTGAQNTRADQTKVATTVDSAFLIKLANREFLPEPGIDKTLFGDDLNQREQYWGIMQLWKSMTNEDRVKFAEADLKVQQYLGGFCYVIGFPSKIDFNKFKETIRWIGPFEPEDKLSKALIDNKLEKWAVTEDGELKILVKFHEGVSSEKQTETVKKYSSQIKSNSGSDGLYIIIERVNLLKLAAETTVQWMEPGPNPIGIF